MEDKKLPWGIHLLIDARNVKPLSDKAIITRFFDDLIRLLNMKKLGPFVLERVDEPDNQGFSAVQMITTSSITFHADELRDSLYLDVFSCKPFAVHEAVALVKETFNSEDIFFRVIDRL